MTQEIFILGAEYDEHGSEKVSVYFSEAGLRSAIGDCEDDIDKVIYAYDKKLKDTANLQFRRCIKRFLGIRKIMERYLNE